MAVNLVVGERRLPVPWGSIVVLWLTRPLRHAAWKLRDWRSSRRYERLARRYQCLDDATLQRLWWYAVALRVEKHSLYRDRREFKRHQRLTLSRQALALVLFRRTMGYGGLPPSVLERYMAGMPWSSAMTRVVEPTLADLRFEQLELRKRGQFGRAGWAG